jgi:hypothetical protein
MTAHRFLLDGNIYNRLDEQPQVRDAVRALVDIGSIVILASPVVVKEMQRSPYGGLPEMKAVLVSDDRRCCKRLRDIDGDAAAAMTFEEFKHWIAGHIALHERQP